MVSSSLWKWVVYYFMIMEEETLGAVGEDMMIRTKNFQSHTLAIENIHANFIIIGLCI